MPSDQANFHPIERLMFRHEELVDVHTRSSEFTNNFYHLSSHHCGNIFAPFVSFRICGAQLSMHLEDLERAKDLNPAVDSTSSPCT